MISDVDSGYVAQEGFAIPKSVTLNTHQLGRIGEALATTKFLTWGFEVFAPEVDDRGIDLVVRTPDRRAFFEVQVKSVTGGNYTFFKETSPSVMRTTTRLLFYIRFLENGRQELFIIPRETWNDPNDVFVTYVRKTDKGFNFLEYGINYSAKNRALVLPYAADGMLERLTNSTDLDREVVNALVHVSPSPKADNESDEPSDSERFCPYCGAPVAVGALFCNTCSSSLG